METAAGKAMCLDQHVGIDNLAIRQRSHGLGRTERNAYDAWFMNAAAKKIGKVIAGTDGDRQPWPEARELHTRRG